MTPELARALELNRAATTRLVAATGRLGSALDRWSRRHRLRRAVLLVDDSPPALLALAAALAPTGLEMHACALDEGVLDALEGLGARAHLIAHCGQAADVWRDVRASVVVVDAHLDARSGGDVLEEIGIGPRAVLVSSRVDTRADRRSVTDAARLAHATPVLRTGSGAWEDALRLAVLRAADDATPTTPESP